MRHLLWSLPMLGMVSAHAAAPAPLPTADLAAAQRGYAIYAQVCSACHSLKQLTYVDLAGLGLDAAQVRALAAARRVTDGLDAAGRPNRRRARPDDHLPSPFPSPQAAAAANNGAVPPDMSRLAMTLPGGADTIARILTSYRDPPPGLAIAPGSFYNPAAPGEQIAMPPPLADGAVAFTDGTPATVPQMARDVAVFLDWAAHPHRSERRRIGVGVVLYLVLLAGLAFLLKRRIWSNVHRNP
jgi:ubiquinol-cytochrome c reductase cytochrome c1 subunit